jgi:diacylglycerol kinase (ATP)
MSVPDLCVIVNPAAGKGRARRLFEGLRRALGPRAEFWLTESRGHAEELAFRAGRAGFALVGAAGGDGTVHEVANGLLRAGESAPPLAIYPIGSANDYAFSLGLAPGWWLRPNVEVAVRPVDAGLVRGPGGRERYFINNLGVGFNGAVNLEACRISWLRGVPLYGLSVLRAMWNHYRHDPMRVVVDGTVRESPTLALTIGLGRKEGSFLLTPNALLDDGLFDVLHAGPLSRWELLRHFPGLVTGDLPADYPNLWRGRCREASVVSERPLIAHVEGEFFCRPEDDVRSLEVSMLPGRFRVQARVDAAAFVQPAAAASR